MASSNIDEARDVVLFNRETGEVLQEMQTITVNREETAGITVNADGIHIRGARMTFQGDRDAEPVEMGATREVIARGQTNARTGQSGASRSIAGGTIDRQRRQEEEQHEPETWTVGADWGTGFANMAGTTYLGFGGDIRTNTIEATQIYVGDRLESVEADTITSGMLLASQIAETGPSQPIEITGIQDMRETFGEPTERTGEYSHTTLYAYDGQILPEPMEITFANGSRIGGLDRDGDVEDSPTLPSSYMGDASDIVARINEAPSMEPMTAHYISLDGEVSFSNLNTNTLPDVMAKTVAVAENAGTFITVPEEDCQEWRTSGDSWVSQGIYPNQADNNTFHKGCWFFGDAMDNLQGKTIHHASLKIKKCFSVGSGEVKAYVVGHPHNDLPTTEPYITKISVLKRIRGLELDSVYVDLSPFKDLISKGLIKGFGVYTDETGLSEFASFERDAELDITWY